MAAVKNRALFFVVVVDVLFLSKVATNAQKVTAESNIGKLRNVKSQVSKTTLPNKQTCKQRHLVGFQWIHLLAGDRERPTENKPNISNGTNSLNPFQ